MTTRKVSRRQFLQSSAALAVAPYFVPSTVLGKDGGVAPSNRIAMVHIGVGGQGGYHLNIQSGRKDLQIVGVCDVDRRKLDSAREKLKGAYGSDAGIRFVQDFRELLAHKDEFDAALIATPDHWHALTTIAMLKNGKDCYTEKPLTLKINEGRALADTARQFGRIVQTGSHERSNWKPRYVADLVRNGYLGKIERVEVNMPVTNHRAIPHQLPTDPPAELDYDLWLGPAPYKPYFVSEAKDPIYSKNYERAHFWFRYQLDYATGEMSDRGAHILDLVQLILDKDGTGPVEVYGDGKREIGGEFDSFMKYDFTIKYADGITVHGTSEGDDSTRGLKIFGENGWINVHVHGGELTASDPRLLEIKLKPSDTTVGRSPGHHQNFYDAIRSRGDTIANAEIGHRTVSVCHITTIAMLVGRTLQWDPQTERFVNDDEANQHLSYTYRAPWSL